jgi:hypothetical protein
MLMRALLFIGLVAGSLAAILPASAQEKPLVIMTSYAS